MVSQKYPLFMTDKSKCQTLGPGGGGALFIPAVSPHDPNTALVATDMTGGFVTRDSGESWDKFHLKTRIDAYAFDSRETETFYAGSSGIFRTTDGGKSWNLLFPDPEKVVEERMIGDEATHIFYSSDNWPGGKTEAIRTQVLLLAVDPEDSGSLFAAVLSVGVSVFHSGNGGKTWTELCRFRGAKLHAMYIDPQTPFPGRTLYLLAENGVFAVEAGNPASIREIPIPFAYKRIVCGSFGYMPENRRNVFMVSVMAEEDGIETGSVFRSTDNGTAWEDITGGLLRELGQKDGSALLFNQLEVCRSKGACAYLSYVRYPAGSDQFWMDLDQYGILQTRDGGESWRVVLSGSPSQNPSNKKTGWLERSYDARWQMIGPKGSFPLGLAAGPNHPDICYATDHGSCYRTLDGGNTWETVYARDHEGGASSSRGLDMTTCYGIHFDPFDPAHWAISYTDMGFFHSRDRGKTWTHAINGMDIDWGNTCYWMVFDPAVRGRAWGAWAYAHDLPRSKMFRFRNLHLRTGGVARTEDGFGSWTRSNAGLPECSTVTHILMDPASRPGSRTLYAAVFTKGVYKSTDDGYSWRPMNAGLGKNLNAWRIIRDTDGVLYLIIARDLEDGSIQYDSTPARGFGSGEGIDGEIYRSRDGAGTWEKVAMPDGANGPYDLAVDPTDPKHLYLACWPQTIARRERGGGVYVSENGGVSWRRIVDESFHVYGITIDERHPGRLFISTFDSAAFRSDDWGETWKKLKYYQFKWGHRIMPDPDDSNFIFLSSSGCSVTRVPVDTGDE